MQWLGLGLLQCEVHELSSCQLHRRLCTTKASTTRELADFLSKRMDGFIGDAAELLI